jgi:hypothetical protein
MRRRLARARSLAGAALAAGLLAGAPPPPPQPCAIPPAPVGSLSHTAPLLRAGGRLDVLAVGSLTLTNPQPLPPQDGFAYRMASALQRMAPGVAVEVAVRGGKGMTAADMVALIRTALAGHAYQLVIWQTGSVDAVQGVPSAQFEAALREGAALIGKAGADLVLVDMQYVRGLSTRLNLLPYENAMRRAAALPDVALLPRYELMRDWATSGTLDLEQVPPAGRERAMGQLQACLGDTLARLVAGGALTAR